MCGWFVERTIALDVLEKELQGIFPEQGKLKEYPFWLEATFYLRETTYFVEAFDWLRRVIEKEKIASLECIPGEIILLRALEIRTEQGFNDPEYQQLLHRPLFRSLIRKVCGKTWENDFANAAKGLALESLSILYNADTFLKDNRDLESMRFNQVIPACRNLLKHYHSRWLKGEEPRKNEHMIHAKETGVCVPIKDITEDQHEQFNILLRALYFSMLTIGKLKASKKILWELARNHPAGCSHFIGSDLWLQRVAALKLYDMLGFEKFIKYFPEFRITLFYYIGIKRGYTQEQKNLLLEASFQYPESAQNDYIMNIKDWNIQD